MTLPSTATRLMQVTRARDAGGKEGRKERNVVPSPVHRARSYGRRLLPRAARLSLPRVASEKGVDRVPDGAGLEQWPAVAPSGDALERDGGANVPERVHQQLALIDGRQRVLVAVHDQERRQGPLGADGGERVRAGDPVRGLLDRPTDQFRLGRVGGVVAHGTPGRIHAREVGRPEPIADRLHAAGGLWPTLVALQVGLAARRPQHGGQVVA